MHTRLVFWVLGFGLWGGAGSLMAAMPAQQPVPVDLTTPTIERTVGFMSDGASVHGGDFGGQSTDCTRGTRGYVRAYDSSGQLLWLRSHDGAEDGVCSNGVADPLFPSWPFDSDHLVSSRVFDLAVDPVTDRVAVTGELLISWLDGLGGYVSSRAAFVVLLDATGTVISSTFLGEDPVAAPPSSTNCVEFCRSSNSSQGPQYGGRAIAWLDGDLVMTGWHRPLAGVDRDPFVARLNGGDLQVEWLAFGGVGGDGVGLALATEPGERILVTGFDGPNRDVWIAVYDLEGALSASYSTGEAWDDSGLAIARDSGRIRVDGRFTDQITFGAVTLKPAQGGPAGFSAWFDDRLGPLDAELDQSSPQSNHSPAGAPLKNAYRKALGGRVPPMESPTFGADSYDVVRGIEATGGLSQLANKDGWTMRIGADPVTAAIDLRVHFHPGLEPGVLKTLRIDLALDGCAAIDVAAKGLGSQELIDLWRHHLCHDGEPVLVVEFPPRAIRRPGL